MSPASFLFSLKNTIFIYHTIESAGQDDGEEFVDGNAECYGPLIGEKFSQGLLCHERNLNIFPCFREDTRSEGLVNDCTHALEYRQREEPKDFIGDTIGSRLSGAAGCKRRAETRVRRQGPEGDCCKRAPHDCDRQTLKLGGSP
eukprot:1427172-Rhodomonas_salina.1